MFFQITKLWHMASIICLGGNPMKHSFSAYKLSFLFILCLTTFFSGCVFWDLKKEVAEFEKLYSLAGKITLPISSHIGSVIVILYSPKEGKNEIVGYTIPADTGHFSFLMPKGAYFLAAFEDLNHNLSHDKGESAGYFGAPDPIMLLPKGRASSGENEFLNCDFHLNQTDRFFSGFSATIDAQKISKSVLVKFGHITTLDDKIFAAENGSTGYWKPLTFLRDFGIGVYFLEPYDPDKIPVLFVHGAVGTPVGWKKIIEKMDRKKFQPWFYYYPSGFRLDDVAAALNEIIKRIHQTYGFKTLYVTAHSMGGLVSRSFITRNVHEDKQDYIKLFVSISTPWNGHRLVAKGIEGAPAAIPSWHDMVPDSEFIRSIYQKDFTSDIKFYLLFSFRGDCSILLNNNDGTVELSSELDYRAQAGAERIIGFDEDHGSILISPKFLELYHAILNEGQDRR
jgi:pimeloyl-ACP methyl ester carboxylesterase